MNFPRPLILLIKSLFIVAFFTCLSANGSSTDDYQPALSTAEKSYFIEKANTEKPLLYFPNEGQIVDTEGNFRPDIKFVVKQPGMTIYIRDTGLSYVFEKSIREAKPQTTPLRREQLSETDAENVKVETYRVDLDFVGAQGAQHAYKKRESAYVENYYLAHCPDGITVHGYEEMVLEEMYPGIDLILYTKEGKLKYDWLVHPGADPATIQMQISGTDAYEINPEGALTLSTPMGSITESAPEIYQEGIQVEGRYVMTEKGIGFSIPHYDTNADLLIDPAREWATYYGGGGNEFGTGGCAVDAAGNVFIHGHTSSSNFPVSNVFQTSSGGNFDAYLVKFNELGVPLGATYYGGFEDELGGGCAVDAMGNVFIHGWTSSADFPISNAFQADKAGGFDTYLVKFTGSGTRLWATYYGGGSDEIGRSGCAVDAAGNVFILGLTESIDFPTLNAFQPGFGGDSDAYLVKFNGAGTLLWATYYGGSEFEDGQGDCSTDASGNVFIHGWTTSTDFPVSNAYQENYGGGNADAYLVKFDGSGTRLWATYYGGSSGDYGSRGCAVDAAGNVFIHGYTYSSDFPVLDAFQNQLAGSSDTYLAKFTGSGERLWATYYGGGGFEFPGGCAVDATGDVFILGETGSNNFPVANAFQANKAVATDAYVVKFDGSGTRLWATYYGGDSNDYGKGGCAVDAAGSVFCHGYTYASTFTNLPLENAFQNTSGGGSDAFLLKFSNTCQNPFPAVDPLSLSTEIGEETLNFFWNPIPGQIGCQVQFLQEEPSLPDSIRSILIVDPEVDQFSVSMDSILPGVNYSWRVRCGCDVRNPIVAGPFTDWQPIVVPSNLGLSSSPNPTNGHSVVSFFPKKNERVSLEVYDLNGRLIQEIYSGMVDPATSYQFVFDGSALSQGIYLYRLTTSSAVINEKFMITK